MIEPGFVVIKLMEVDSVYVVHQVGQLFGYFRRFLPLSLIPFIFLVVVEVSIRLISILGGILGKTLGLDQNLPPQFFRRGQPLLLLEAPRLSGASKREQYWGWIKTASLEEKASAIQGEGNRTDSDRHILPQPLSQKVLQTKAPQGGAKAKDEAVDVHDTPPNPDNPEGNPGEVPLHPR